MPDFKAVVFAEGQLPFTVACSFYAVNSAFDVYLQQFFNDFFSSGRTAEIAETMAL
jgi:hypothetical protein